MQWFRLYNEILNDPKVQSLDGNTFKAWINLLCVASQCNTTCNVTDVSFHLRCTQKEAADYILTLVDAGLFHNNDGILSPNNWDKRQYKSDSSKERVERHREKKRNVTTPLPVTPPEQIQNRTDTEHNIKKKEGGNFVLRLPDWLPLEDWNDYLEMRDKKGKGKATNRAKQLVIIKLNELRERGHDPGKILQQSIINGWTSVFEIKENNNGNKTGFAGTYRTNDSGANQKPSSNRDVLMSAILKA